MDQVKEYLEILKKHHFWLLLVIAIVSAVVAYRSGASTFSATYTSRKAAIEGKFSDVSRVASTPNHPNQTFLDGIGQLHDQEKQLTLAAWQTLYQKQSEVLRWPEQFQAIENLPDNAEIDANDRYAYMNYARDQLPRLLDIVKVRHKETIVDENGEEKEVERGLVEWDEQSRSELEQLFEWDRQPTTKRVRYTQEALWVYEALLEIIAKTNEGATAFYNAPIKEIIELRIAQAASQATQSDVELFGPSGGGPSPQSSRSESSPPSVPGRDATDEELGEGRYVDSQGNPIAASQAESGEFKLMPIRMKLVMDQRKIPDLLANCANSELTVEVRRVRINPDVKPQTGPQGGSVSRPRSAGMSSSRTQSSGGQLEDPYDVTVELYGLIYIFNRPNRQKLGIVDATPPGGAGANVPASGVPDATAVPASNNASGPGL